MPFDFYARDTLNKSIITMYMYSVQYKFSFPAFKYPTGMFINTSIIHLFTTPMLFQVLKCDSFVVIHIYYFG